MREFLHWHDSRGFRHALYILESDRLDRVAAHSESCADRPAGALDWIDWAADQIKKGRTFASWEIEREAKRLEREGQNGSPVIKPENTYTAWRAEKGQREAWCALVDSALPPFERRAPRDPAGAEFLRTIGTPDELIGPAGPSPVRARKRIGTARRCERLIGVGKSGICASGSRASTFLAAALLYLPLEVRTP